MKALILAGVIAAVNAQSGAYGQCGGINWTGATTCISGYTCTVINDCLSSSDLRFPRFQLTCD